jgi:hypothetical protein
LCSLIRADNYARLSARCKGMMEMCPFDKNEKLGLGYSWPVSHPTLIWGD